MTSIEYAAEIARIADLERAAGREPHALIAEIGAAIVDPASKPRDVADRLAAVVMSIIDVRASALAMLANYAARAEHSRRVGKASAEEQSVRDADAAILRHAKLSAP